MSRCMKSCAAMRHVQRVVRVRAAENEGEGTLGRGGRRRDAVLGGVGSVAMGLGLVRVGPGRDEAYAAGSVLADLGFTRGPEDEYALLPALASNEREATFAGGCFWCMEAPFDKLDGVSSTTSGYIGGKKTRPSYREVSSGRTGHCEAVRVAYDPSKVSYETLLDAFFHSVDPTTKDRQFVDVGNQYRTAIYYYSDEQKEAAEKMKAELDASHRFGNSPIVTEITPASIFWPAEEYHQDYYVKSANRYKFYRSLSGRDEYIASVWGKGEASS